jgi:hypothetical protein
VRKLEPIQLRPWTLPLIVLAVAVPIVAAFTLAGPGAGLAVGALVAATIVVLAARARFDEPIEVGASVGDRYLVLVVVTESIEDPRLAGAIAEIALAGAKATREGSERDADVVVLAPALNTRVSHWRRLGWTRGLRWATRTPYRRSRTP